MGLASFKVWILSDRYKPNVSYLHKFGTKTLLCSIWNIWNILDMFSTSQIEKKSELSLIQLLSGVH
jgi:hypothetical protein